MRKVLILICICISMFAKKQILADINPAKVFYISFDNRCDDFCLKNLLYNGLYISYVANFHSKDEELNNIYTKLINGIDYIKLPARKTIGSVKIAILIPENIIKSYSSNIISPALAYLIAQNQDVHVKVFFTHDESENNINPIIPKLQDYSLIITGFQNQGIRILNKSINNINIFSPLANANNFNNINANFTFGSINYDEQVSKLLNIANQNIVIFKDDSVLADKISQSISQQSDVKLEETISKNSFNINQALSSVWKLNNASVFFNLPLVKTALIATQIRANKINPKMYLSTQINYHPIFLNLAQDNERSMFYFANSIGNIDEKIEYLNDLLGQKIAYNWIAYSTSVGLDYYFHQLYLNDGNRTFTDEFIGNALHFNVRIMNAKHSKFSDINR